MTLRHGSARKECRQIDERRKRSLRSEDKDAVKMLGDGGRVRVAGKVGFAPSAAMPKVYLRL